jgi:hypothetical protein
VFYLDHPTGVTVRRRGDRRSCGRGRPSGGDRGGVRQPASRSPGGRLGR